LSVDEQVVTLSDKPCQPVGVAPTDGRRELALRERSGNACIEESIWVTILAATSNLDS